VSNKAFEATCCLPELGDRRGITPRLLKMKAVRSFETSLNNNPVNQRKNLKDLNPLLLPLMSACSAQNPVLKCPTEACSQMPNRTLFSNAQRNPVLKCPTEPCSQMPNRTLFSNAQQNPVLKCPLCIFFENHLCLR
jgi:hypothetical protein